MTSPDLQILTVSYTRPDYIAYQYECLRRFITVPFTYVVYDNAPTEDISKKTKQMCDYLGVTHTRVPQDIMDTTNGSFRAGRSLTYALHHTYSVFRGVVFVCDSDCFLVAPYNPLAVLGDHDYVGRSMERNYLCNEPDNILIKQNYIYYMNQYAIINFNGNLDPLKLDYTPGAIGNMLYDCGGKLRLYFLSNPNIKHRAIHDIPAGTYTAANVDTCPALFQEYFKKDIALMSPKPTFSEIFDNALVHFRGGGNWMGHSDELTYKREDNLFTFLCNRLIDWNIPRPAKYVISFALYGSNPKYTQNMIINALLAKKIYRGWIVRVYYDSSVDQQTVNTLRKMDHVELVEAAQLQDTPGHERMMWRFYPIEEPDVAVMMSRDADAWLSFREAYSVKAWLDSPKKAHIIRDHCYHSQKMMGGMFGMKGNMAIKEAITDYAKQSRYDQGFLAEYVYPQISNDAMVHYTLGQKNNRGQLAHGYFPDGGTPLVDYPKICHYFPNVSVEELNANNSFRCQHCSCVHPFFVGIQMANISAPVHTAIAFS